LNPAFRFDKLPWAGVSRDWGYSSEFLMVYPFSFGYLGVAIFFVISGYCIHLSHMRNSRDGWTGFFIRRWFRIYPAYLLAIAVFLLVPPWGGIWMNADRLVQVCASVFAVQNLSPQHIYGINPSFWSIAVEIQLYLIYPLLLLLVRWLDWKRTLILVGTMEFMLRVLPYFLARNDLGMIPFSIRSSPFTYWASWAVGAYLAESHMRNKSSLLARLRFDTPLILTLVAAQFKLTDPLTFPLCALTTAIAMDRLHRGNWRAPDTGIRTLIWKHLSKVGVISYSFYLFHQPILSKVGKSLREMLPPLAIVGCLLLLYPLILMVARLGHRYLELPSISLGKKAITYLRARRSTG
ncbi:MAG TPA: acyltransferase, partial [Flavobacteriales bacterium]|nr:acyltransferase [Flavobacteriales bacterium]